MNPETAAALASLRGLHLPKGATGAVQGEVVAAIALGFAAALAVGLLRWLRARQRASLRRAALAELAASAELDPQSRRVAQARIVRRLVRSLKGEAAAAERGAVWAATLDRTFDTDFFSRGAGRSLADGLYRRPEADDPAATEAGLERLFARIRA